MRAEAKTKGILSAVLSRRGLLPFSASVLYVGAAALRADGARDPRRWMLALFAIGLALSASRAPRPDAKGGAVLDPTSYAVWGMSLVLASLAAETQSAWLDAFGGAGACVAGLAACVALGRLAVPRGVAQSLRGWRGSAHWAMAAVVLGWAAACAAAVLAASEGGPDPRVYGSAAAGWGFTVLLASAARAAQVRRLLLGAADRAQAALGLVVAVVLGTLAWLAMGTVSADRALRLSFAATSVLLTVVMLRGDPVSVARAWRRAAILLTIGGPVVLLGALAAEGRETTLVVLLTAAAALLIGSVAEKLEKPLRPEGGAWLDAIDEAHSALVRADPELSVRDALRAMRSAAGSSAESPELWALDPPRVLTIDAAGYARERSADVPPALLEVARGEPDGTLRSELLDALLVRRPDLRPIARWMDERGALWATLVARDNEIEGLLVLPRGKRVVPLTLEEARSLKKLADAFSGAIAAHGAIARSLARERVSAQRAEAAEDKLADREHREALTGEREERISARLSRGATIGFYSVAARSALEAIERRVMIGAPVVLVVPSGVDAVPYLARAHASGPRRSKPLVVVDGASSAEHAKERWNSPTASPLALAQGGLLALVDGAALPDDVQRLLAQALAERRAPWGRGEALDLEIAFTGTLAPEELVAASRLDRALAARLGDAVETPIALPALGDRPEDLRALVNDKLAREGLRVRGTPVGIDDAAFARLADHSFPGGDAELTAIVVRLLARTTGELIRAADVDALALGVPGDGGSGDGEPAGPRINVTGPGGGVVGRA